MSNKKLKPAQIVPPKDEDEDDEESDEDEDESEESQVKRAPIVKAKPVLRVKPTLVEAKIPSLAPSKFIADPALIDKAVSEIERGQELRSQINVEELLNPEPGEDDAAYQFRVALTRRMNRVLTAPSAVVMAHIFINKTKYGVSYGDKVDNALTKLETAIRDNEQKTRTS